MKIYEIVAEKYYPIEEERLDEALPLIAGLSVGGVITAISVVLAAMSFADLIKFIGKYNEDPSKISEEEWNDLFIDVMLLAIPGVAKLGRPIVVKLMRKNKFTRAALTKGGKWLNAKVSDLWTKKKPAKFNQDYRQRLKQAKIDYPKSELAKNLAKSKFKAGLKLKEIGSVYNWVVNIGGSAYYIQDYYTNIGVLEKEWEDWVNSTKNNTPLKMPNRFADMTYSDAEAKFDSERNTLLGKATIGIVTSTGFAPAFFKFASGKAAMAGIAAMKTGTATGIAGGGAVAASMGILNAGARLMNLVAGKGPGGIAGRTAIITWLETTKEGKDFQQAWAVQMLFSVTGWITDKVLAGLRIAYNGLRELAAKFGINLPALSDKLQPGGGSQKPDKELKDKEEKERAARDAKMISVGGVSVTDRDGYLINDPTTLRIPKVQYAITQARDTGKPNPFDAIPLKPGVNYDSEVKMLIKTR
jgi:hypothetical protein